MSGAELGPTRVSASDPSHFKTRSRPSATTRSFCQASSAQANLNPTCRQTDSEIMTVAPNWRTHFKIPAQAIETALASGQLKSKDEDDLLYWSLQAKLVSENEYLAWASEAYLLPTVRPEFFAQPRDHVFWERTRKLADWNSHCFPLAEWQGFLLIGCVAPPRDFHLRQPHIFVLASARLLTEAYTAFTSSAPPQAATLKTAFHPAAQQEAPSARVVADVGPGLEADEIVFDDSNTAHGLDITGPHQVDTSEQTGENRSDAMKPDLADILRSRLDSNPEEEGADSEFDRLARQFDEPLSDELGGVPSEESAETATPAETLEGVDLDIGSRDLDLDFSSVRLSTSPPPSQPSSEEPSRSADMARPTSPSQGLNTAKLVPPASDIAPPPIPPRETTPRGGAVFELAPAKHNQNLTSAANAETKDKSSRSVSAQTPLVLFDLCKTYDDVGVQALAHTLRTFEKAVIFTFRNNELRPWMWSDGLPANHVTTDAEMKAAIPLETPSIFRIVFRTCLPYHGYVAPCPVNDAFFKRLGVETPSHATIVPLLVNTQMAGMLMGFTNQTITAYKETLKTMHKLGNEVATHLLRLRGGAKAA